MPFVRSPSGLIYFAHVPKCGGTSVERYLRGRFGKLALHDGRFLMRPPEARWSKSSRQHLTITDLEQLIPVGFFDLSFAVVRHPVDRLVSLFRYQRDIVGRIAPGVAFSRWLDLLPQRLAEKPYYLDNHPRPICDFVPEGARIFRLEDGLAPVAEWLDALPGGRCPRLPMGAQNSYADKLKESGGAPGPKVVVSDTDRARIAEIYGMDFDRFGYEVNSPVIGSESGSDMGGSGPDGAS